VGIVFVVQTAQLGVVELGVAYQVRVRVGGLEAWGRAFFSGKVRLAQ
jgi:hypothetical protein